MNAAVTKMASVFRMYRHRNLLNELRAERLALETRSTIVMQAFMRMKIHRLNFLDWRCAAVVLQCCIRRVMARKLLTMLVTRRAILLEDRAEAGTEYSLVTVGCNTMPRNLVRRCLRYLFLVHVGEVARLLLKPRRGGNVSLSLTTLRAAFND